MRIKRICYPVKVLGPGNRVGIWVTGCPFKCKGCISPELQYYDAGNEISVERLLTAIKRIDGKIDGLTISGGEPFEQPSELCAFIKAFRDSFSNDIIIYSGYTFEELKNKKDKDIDEILNIISVLIDGRYIDELNDGKGLRGSSNQNIIIFRNHERFEYMKDCTRQLQTFNYPDNSSIVIGVM